MNKRRLPAELERFLGDFSSIRQMEILLLLRKRADRRLREEEIVDELRLGTHAASAPLDALVGLRLVRRDESRLYLYDPASAALAGLTDLLAQAYAERPVAVVEAIYSRPSSSIRAFADAFKLK